MAKGLWAACLMVVILTVAGGSDVDAFQQLTKSTNLTIYVNETEMMKVVANLTGPAFQFGTVTVWKSPLLTELDSQGKIIGHIDGLNAFTGDDSHLVSAVLVMSYEGLEGSITIFGSTLADWDARREYAVTGGTRSFKGAKGEATFTHPYDNTTGLYAKCEISLLF